MRFLRSLTEHIEGNTFKRSNTLPFFYNFKRIIFLSTAKLEPLPILDIQGHHQARGVPN